jgi:outer membrane protein OmpA-like peptidoglycan-associated protein
MKNANCIRLSMSASMALVVTLAAMGCATTTPPELTNARLAYNRASAGPAAQLTPADLHKAKSALDEAERTFASEDDSQKTIDLSYIAERSAQIAEARAATVIAEKKASGATRELGATQGAMVKKAQGDLDRTRDELAEAERGKALQAQQAGTERTARNEADKKAAASEQKAVASDEKAAASDERAAAADRRAAEANDALAKLAAKEEERGMVITLSGSVLFRSNDSALLPAALVRLDQVADALVAKNHDVVVEGYTDSKGSQSSNMNLSQRRAESVRSYLVTKGFPMEKIVAKGMGPDRPIADNTTAEGRANNRRVEIVIAKGTPRTN